MQTLKCQLENGSIFATRFLNLDFIVLLFCLLKFYAVGKLINDDYFLLYRKHFDCFFFISILVMSFSRYFFPDISCLKIYSA